MNKSLFNLLTIFLLIPLFACQRHAKKIVKVDNNTYINDFELLQDNPNNNTRIKITSPKAIIYPVNNDIEIYDSSIEILKINSPDIKIVSGNSTLSNYKNLIRVYDNVKISLLDKKNTYIKTNSFDWNLNTSNIIINNSLFINFDSTTISSLSGIYNINDGHLKINNNIFNRNIKNNDGQTIYKINIKSDIASLMKNYNTLEFLSKNNQVETTINFLRFK